LSEGSRVIRGLVDLVKKGLFSGLHNADNPGFFRKDGKDLTAPPGTQTRPSLVEKPAEGAGSAAKKLAPGVKEGAAGVEAGTKVGASELIKEGVTEGAKVGANTLVKEGTKVGATELLKGAAPAALKTAGKGSKVLKVVPGIGIAVGVGTGRKGPTCG
jgi:hypothetical protein